MLFLPLLLLLGLIGLPALAEEKEMVTTTAKALHQRLGAAGAPLVVDVREADEFEAVHIARARLAPLRTVAKALEQTPKDTEIVLVCRTGRRSGIAYRTLAELGFTRLANLEGGMVAWEKLGLPVVKGR